MPREFSVGWYETLARAIFGYQQHTPLGLEDAVRAVVAFETERPEWGFLKNEFGYVTPQLTEGAVAAEFAYIGLRNKADSGILAVAEAFFAAGGGNEFIARTGTEAVISPAVRLASKAAVVQDSRLVSSDFQGGPPPACDVIQGTATAAEIATLSTPFGNWKPQNTSGGAATNQWLIGKAWAFVLAPGTFLAWFDILANNAIAGVIIRWRERPLFKGLRA